MLKKIVVIFLGCSLGLSVTHAQTSTATTPLNLQFHRLAVRRYIFSNNIPLNELKADELVDIGSMHPALSLSSDDQPNPDTGNEPAIQNGQIIFSGKRDKSINSTTINVGGVNPFATYELAIQSVHCKKGSTAEIGVDLASESLHDRVEVVVRYGHEKPGVYLRLFKNGQSVRELKFSNEIPMAPYRLQVQLAGRELAVFITTDGKTICIGHTLANQQFGDVIDFRDRTQCANAIFNIITNLSPLSTLSLTSAKSYLSPGVGQADIRLITHKDGSPYLENGRVWFTFSCRGIDTQTSYQGVMSFNPSIADFRFDGGIVFDHGDGLLRNDYASHIFYDDDAKEWRALSCDFGGTAGHEGRRPTGLIVASSKHDPRFGFSVMQAKALTADQIEGRHEDPCIIYDATVKKWRLLTSAFVEKNIAATLFESDRWDGGFKKIAGPVRYNSTGTLIQKIDGKYYAFSGGQGPMSIYSYPDLTLLGNVRLDLPPGFPRQPGRVWPTIFPLPEGYPYNYLLLTMDRDNYPGIKGPNWSYGALYLYGAYAEK